MRCINEDKVENIPFGYRMTGRRFKDIEISMREIDNALRVPGSSPETIMRYLMSLKYTLRPA